VLHNVQYQGTSKTNKRQVSQPSDSYYLVARLLGGAQEGKKECKEIVARVKKIIIIKACLLTKREKSEYPFAHIEKDKQGQSHAIRL
jgi:hypothetical protein